MPIVLRECVSTNISYGRLEYRHDAFALKSFGQLNTSRFQVRRGYVNRACTRLDDGLPGDLIRLGQSANEIGLHA